MGAFTRSGAFKDRTRFLAAVKTKISKLRDGALRGFQEKWEEGTPAKAFLTGFGAKLTFTIDEASWRIDAEIPSWLPVPQSAIEDKFDREFKELEGL